MEAKPNYERIETDGKRGYVLDLHYWADDVVCNAPSEYEDGHRRANWECNGVLYDLSFALTRGDDGTFTHEYADRISLSRHGRFSVYDYTDAAMKAARAVAAEVAEHVNAHQELSQAGAIMASVDKLGYAKTKLDEAQQEYEAAAQELQEARLAAGRVNA